MIYLGVMRFISEYEIYLGVMRFIWELWDLFGSYGS